MKRSFHEWIQHKAIIEASEQERWEGGRTRWDGQHGEDKSYLFIYLDGGGLSGRAAQGHTDPASRPVSPSPWSGKSVKRQLAYVGWVVSGIGDCG